MKFLKFSFLAVLIVLFSTCHNKLELNAPYKEIPSIYAVLDPSESIQMIRINKVFLGESDANKMAKIADSINYPEKELTVSLQRFDGGVPVNPSKSSTNLESLFRDSLVRTVDGSFNTTQRVYVLYDSLFYDGEYLLTVKNNRTGNVFKARANSISKVVPFSKQLSQGPYYPYPKTPAPPNEDYIDYSNDNPKPPYELRYMYNKSAYMYQLFIRYWFEENVFGDTRLTFADYNAGTRTAKDVQNLSGYIFLSHTFNGAGIYASLGNTISKFDNNISGRKVKYIEYIVYNTTQEYYDYLEYVKPSLSLNQNKPLYSNFENSAALGLFTFRTSFHVKKEASSFYINAMAYHPSLCKYKMYDQNNTVPGCK